MQIRKFKSWAIKYLEGFPTAALDVSVLMEFFLKKDKTQLLLHPEYELSSDEYAMLYKAVSLRKTGLPVAYITGRKEFWGYSFIVSPDVLIPKPDTEVLVETALSMIVQRLHDEGGKSITLCDICTGSGCVGISVLKALSEMKGGESTRITGLTLTDISPAALNIAERNARALLTDKDFKKAEFVLSDLFSRVPQSFDVILSNPPYVPATMVDELLKDGRNEPGLALDGDAYGDAADGRTQSGDGLSIIRSLVPQCMEHLNEGGLLIIETGEYNALQTKALFEEAGFRGVRIIKDLEGQERDVLGVKC